MCRDEGLRVCSKSWRGVVQARTAVQLGNGWIEYQPTTLPLNSYFSTSAMIGEWLAD